MKATTPLLAISLLLALANAPASAGYEQALAAKFTQNGFANVAVSRLSRDVLYPASASATPEAPRLNLTILLIRETGWTPAQAIAHVKEIARTYNSESCRILLGDVLLVEADPYLGYKDIDWASIYPAPANARDVQIARQVPAEAPRPVIGLMRSSAQGSSAWANPRHRIKPEIAPLLNFTWITAKVNSEEYKKRLPAGYNPVAHELAHLLGDTGHNDFPEPNILHDDFNKINDRILPSQCETFLRSPLLRR